MLSVAVEDLWALAPKVDWGLSAEVVVDWLQQVAGGIPQAVQQEPEYLPSFLTAPFASGSSSRAILSSGKQPQRQERTERIVRRRHRFSGKFIHYSTTQINNIKI